MSLIRQGQSIRCDGKGCQAEASAPVALRSTLGGERASNTTYGWLFVIRHSGNLHFCPNCALLQIQSVDKYEEGSGKRPSTLFTAGEPT
jgi:hypothetical protein